jgi:uncharacterized repeat protein (TIGR03803 family)
MLQRLLPFGLAASLAFSSHAQDTFWGLSSYGGQNNAGTVFTLTNAGVFTKRADLQLNDGNTMRSELTKATDGFHYGVAYGGGHTGVGLLFRFDPATNAYTILHHMQPSTGSNPDKGVMQASNGKLYGVCRFGGANGAGTLYEYDLTTNTFTKRVDFGGANGVQPRGRLVEVSGGRLVGVTQQGGSGSPGFGTAFDFDINTNTFTKRTNFLGGTSGANPASGLVPNPTNANQLLGTCTAGGANSVGIIYSYNINTYGIVKRADLSTATGSVPFAELCAVGGVMYGLASAGGTNLLGTVFSYDATTFAVTKLFDLSTSSGNTPYGRLILASNGLLYGLTSKGSSGDRGTLFSFNPGTNQFLVRYNLSSGNASTPFAGLLEDGAGTLYGTFSALGGNGQGGIFRFLVGTSAYTELVALGRSTAAYPKGSLMQASNGLLYGLASGGGTSNVGAVFSVDPATGTCTPLASFTSTLGSTPTGRLVQVGSLLYGVCETGGANVAGTIFSFNPATNSITKLADLQTSTGRRPLAGLTPTTGGLLYGTTSEGGANSFGTIFTFNTSTNAVTVVHNFTPGDGSVSTAELIEASTGDLYGVRGGQGNLGLVFRLIPASNIYTVPVTFSGVDGSSPTGALVEAIPGKLYGITREGGANGAGVIYSYTITSNIFTVEHEMTTTEGSASEGGLVEGTDSKLYGMCAEGGITDVGTLFQFDPASTNVTLLRSLSFLDGANPLDGLFLQPAAAQPSVQLAAKVFLEGPYVSGTGLMNDALRTQPAFPLSEPFTALGFANVVSGNINAAVLATTGNNAIVDWLLVELRNKNNSAQVVTAVPALVQRDGDVVALDGASALTIAQPADNYFVAFRHRNHLGVMTATAVALGASPTVLNMTTGAVPTFGTAAQKQVGTVWTSWAGNATPNNQLKYTGSGNDRDPILLAIGGSVPTNTITGYRVEDCNMDAVVKYTGSANDRDIILLNIGGSVPTNTRAEQLP